MVVKRACCRCASHLAAGTVRCPDSCWQAGVHDIVNISLRGLVTGGSAPELLQIRNARALLFVAAVVHHELHGLLFHS